MTQKQAIIKAITNFDVDMLDIMLDQESYMKVSKELFLKKLRNEFYYLKNDSIDKFINVIEIDSSKFLKGRTIYTFFTDNQRTLDLLFVETEDHVVDLVVLYDFQTDEPVEKDSIYFSFKEDERVDYNPTVEVRQHQNRIEKILSDFKKQENTIVEIDTFKSWLSEYSEISDLVRPYSHYKFIEIYNHLSQSVSRVYDLVRYHEFAEVAMKHYNAIDLANESEVIDWLLQYDGNDLCWYDDFTITEKWQKTNFVLFKNYIYEEGVRIYNYNNLIIDVSRYSSSLAFTIIYLDLHEAYTTKYLPTVEMYEERGGISYGLYHFLSVWGLFPEVLKRHTPVD